MSDTAVGQYQFYAEGYVSATLGEKGGAVFAPILEYKIVGNNSVELLSRGESFELWSDVQIVEDTLYVTSRGRKLTFKILPVQPQ